MFKVTIVYAILFCHFGITMQDCDSCLCCMNGKHSCDPDHTSKNGCILGFYGNYCTDKCPENCISCESKYSCTNCKSGYYTRQCNTPCGKGCINNTCSISGYCPYKSTNFTDDKCDYCVGNTYGDDCNIPCPNNCSSCSSETYCSLCKNSSYYGSHCQNKCSQGCDYGACNKKNGHCDKGCKLHFSGTKCDTCSSGKYGEFCDSNCPANCSVCTSLLDCSQCKTGYYGETCKRECSFGCNGQCLFTDGRCHECKPGFTGRFCNLKCEAGTYGANCSKHCSDFDNNCLICNTNERGFFGDCTSCKSGYYPDIPSGYNNTICMICSSYCYDKECDNFGLCKKGCVRGKWGQKCGRNCTTNCAKCSQTLGKCLECTRETFSDDCSRNCSTNCSDTTSVRICAEDTGSCLQGCKSLTKYGEYCEKHCNGTCNNETCNWRTGFCTDGCVENYFGSFCGKTCADTCKKNENKRFCDDQNGYCLFGCKNGFYGNRCEGRCSRQCVNTTCNQVTAECLSGCIVGYEGMTCTQATKGTWLTSSNGLMIVAAVGIVVSVVFVVLTFCLIKRKRRRGLSAEKSQIEHENTQSMQMTGIQYEEIDSDVAYGKPVKATSNSYEDARERFDTRKGNKQEMPDIDADYAVVSDEKLVDEAEAFPYEVYDTTLHHKNSRNLESNNVYAVLNVKSEKSVRSGTQSIDGDEVYDTTEEKKNNTLLQPFNDYASHSSCNMGQSNTDISNDLYDSTSKGGGNKIESVPVNSDYDLFSEATKPP